MLVIGIHCPMRCVVSSTAVTKVDRLTTDQSLSTKTHIVHHLYGRSIGFLLGILYKTKTGDKETCYTFNMKLVLSIHVLNSEKTSIPHPHGRAMNRL